jgi:NAD+ diphosphatase
LIWGEALKYCLFCGNDLVPKILLDGSEEKYCATCDHVFFDSPTPAIIVAVIMNNQILLTRSVGWNHLYWGLIAGHIKAGESAEETVVREVYEEVGLKISNPYFLGTYAHKQRNLLMIGFKAETKEMQIKKSIELEEVSWFKLTKKLPLRPNSISHQIVEKILHESTRLIS